jgi:2-amino-4-hydroxy-6-hydroxymethyldihydropteridine diphosphokinase
VKETGAGGPVRVWLGLGSNLGHRVAALRTGVAELVRAGLEPEAFSDLYHSRPKYFTDQPPFVNAVGRFYTRLTPLQVLAACRAAEAAAGRRPGERYGPRELDVDLLLYGNRQVREKELTIPHPALAERLFVLVPLAALDPELEVPGIGPVTGLLTVALERLPEEERVVSLGGFVPDRGRPLESLLLPDAGAVEGA